VQQDMPRQFVAVDGPLGMAPTGGWLQAFAMAVELHRAGLFTWPEWAAALSAQISAAQAAGDADCAFRRT
jgi:hypothetical protein